MAAHNAQEVARFMMQVATHQDIYKGDEALEKIVLAVVEDAAERAFNAGMSGSHSDDGASASIQVLKAFLDGVRYGSTRDAENLGRYYELYEKLERENDPQYKEYLRLKEIYGES